MQRTLRLLVLAAVVTAAGQLEAQAQEPPNLPTEAANPPHNDVWIWVEQPIGALPRQPVTIRFWAFRCGGTIKSVRPSTIHTRTLPNVNSNQPRPDIVALMASKCSKPIPTNIGYSVTMDLQHLPSGPYFGYMLDVEVTDDLNRKTMLRQTRGFFTIQ